MLILVTSKYCLAKQTQVNTGHCSRFTMTVGTRENRKIVLCSYNVDHTVRMYNATRLSPVNDQAAELIF